MICRRQKGARQLVGEQVRNRKDRTTPKRIKRVRAILQQIIILEDGSEQQQPRRALLQNNIKQKDIQGIERRVGQVLLKRTIISLLWGQFLQSILYACHQPILPLFSNQNSSNTRPYHAAFRLSKNRGTSCHRTNRKYLSRASCHWHTDPHICDHQSTQFYPPRASCCFTTDLRICDSCTTHTPLSFIKCTLSVNLVIEELSLIITTVQEFQDSFPGLSTIFVLSFVFLTVKPLLNPLTILFVFFPLSHIFGPIRMSVSSLTICLVVEPLSLIYITIRVVKNSLTVGFIILPLSHILAPICPNLSPHPFSHSLLPFPLIGDAVVELDRTQLHDFSAIDCGFDQFIIFFSLPPFEEVGYTLFDFSVPVTFRFYGLRFASSSRGIYFLFFFFGFRVLLVGAGVFLDWVILRFFAGFRRQEILIFRCFEVAVLAFEGLRGQIVLNLLLFVRFDLSCVFIHSGTCSDTYSHNRIPLIINFLFRRTTTTTNNHHQIKEEKSGYRLLGSHSPASHSGSEVGALGQLRPHPTGGQQKK